MTIDRIFVIELLEVLRAHEVYQVARDRLAALRGGGMRHGTVRPSTLTVETVRVREKLEDTLADAPPD